jgi:hypothetical protein
MQEPIPATSILDIVAQSVVTSIIPSTTTITKYAGIVQEDPQDGCTQIGSILQIITGISATSMLQALDICFPACEGIN